MLRLLIYLGISARLLGLFFVDVALIVEHLIMVVLVSLISIKYRFRLNGWLLVTLWVLMFANNSTGDWIYAIWIFLGLILMVACRDEFILDISSLGLATLSILFLLPNLGAPYELGRSIFGMDVFLPGYASTAVLIFCVGTYFTYRLKSQLALILIGSIYTLLLLQTGVKTYTFLFVLNTVILIIIRSKYVLSILVLCIFVGFLLNYLDFSEVDLFSVSGRLPISESTADFYGYGSVSEYWWDHSFKDGKKPYELENMPPFDGVIWVFTYFGGYLGLGLMFIVLRTLYWHSIGSDIYSKILVIEMSLLFLISNHIDSMYLVLLYSVVNTSKKVKNEFVIV